MASMDAKTRNILTSDTGDPKTKHLSTNVFSFNNWIRIKTLGFLLLFFLASPITWMITLFTLVIHLATRKPTMANPNAKRILISGGGMTKSLQLVRLLHSAGHSVFLTEEYTFTAHRFSRCVTKFILCVDTKNNDSYIESIVDIVRREKIDVFIPVSHSWCECAESLLKERLGPLHCEMFQCNIDQVKMLSDKYEFATQARLFGLSTPKTFKITDPKQVLEFDFSKEKCQFVLKSILDNNLTRWDLVKFPLKNQNETIDYLKNLNITQDNPWILQEFIPGKEYCTHGALRNGELRLYACCESSSWLLRYKHVANKPLILEWVRSFCSRANLTGQISFDFIESNEDGRPYAIECNPRTHTAVTTFYNNPLLANAYLENQPLPDGPIVPYTNSRETYWLHHELWNLFKVRNLPSLRRQLDILVNGKEAIYSMGDPLPFFFQYTVHMPCVLILNLMNPVDFKKVDCNLGMIL